jgi:transcriptional regulator with XRE-family HTH domain
MDWVEKFDELKKKLGLSSDAALARALGVTPQYLSDVRKGGKPASPLLKFRVLDKLAHTWTEAAALDLLPDEVRALVREKLRVFKSGSKEATELPLRAQKARGASKQKA